MHLSDRLTQADYLGSSEASPSFTSLSATKTPALHLAVSVRAFRAEALSEFVGAVIDGDAERARSIRPKLDNYPLVLTRDLDATRHWLRSQARGGERTGLVASSNALRLKPVGLHVRAKIDPTVWFLAGKDDVRSPYALEEVATEFDIQGLEFNWVGMGWDANLRWTNKDWQPFSFRGDRWTRVNDPTRAAYLPNAYRALLTRARQGMMILVPEGSTEDHTRDPAYYDITYAFLRRCEIRELK